MVFSRTISGKKNKFYFVEKVIVWVEGPDDIVFFDRLLRDMGCKLDPAGGKNECLKLAEGIVEEDLPYVVIIDGDYDVLKRQRSAHRSGLPTRNRVLRGHARTEADR